MDFEEGIMTATKSDPAYICLLMEFRWPAVRAADEQDSGRDGVERSGTEPIGHLTALRRTFEFSGLKLAVVMAADCPPASATV